MSEDAKVGATGVVVTTGANASGTRYTEEALRKAVEEVQEDVKQRRSWARWGRARLVA